MVFSLIPQVITEDRASGAQVVEGSLKFDGGYLTRTPSVSSNRRIFTWSAWIKRSDLSSRSAIWGAGTTNGSNNPGGSMYFNSSTGTLQVVNGGGTVFSHVTSASHRDTGWYHILISINTVGTPRVAIYINGEQATASGTIASQSFQLDYNNTIIHAIGSRTDDGSLPASIFKGHMSQVYLIDGQQLGPEEFGYTDLLTNTWRPKKFEHLSTSIATQYSGASALTWDDNPIGSIYTLSNGNRTATAGEGTSSGYSGADVWSNAIPANSTTAWTLEITNSDSVGGWYFADAQTASGTHPDERGGNSMGLRNQDADAAFRGTFATANGYSNSGNQLSLPGCETFGSRRVDFVVYRPASGTGKVWVKDNGASTWVGGGNPSDTSSTPSFVIPDGNTYFGYTFYDRSNGDQIATFDGDGSIHQKAGANSFYLPMDGNTPIGKDQSGRGNDWTPVGFGGSLEVSKATGAIPVLNTNDSGTIAKPGVRTDKKTYTVTASGGNYYLDGALKPTLNAYRGGSYTFDYTGATSHPFYLSSLPDGKHNSKAYSVEFGGSDYLSVPDSDDFNLAGNDWTIEAFVYHSSTNYTSYEGILAQWVLGSGTARTWTLETVGSGATSDLEFYYVDSNNNQVGPVQGGTLTKDKWHHVAACRSGNTIRMFVDGVMYGSGTTINVDIKNSTDPLWIGRVVDGYWNGHISNARVVNGTALYTTNFTPPSTTLTNVTNTKLLCCQDSDATTGAVLPSGSAITVNGSAAASQTRQPFLYNNVHGNFGLNTGTSNTTKITIPHLAADTLYYYCNAHSGMGSSINVTTDIFKADPYAWKCMFAMASDTVDHSPELNVNSTASIFGDIHTTNLQGLRNFYGHSKKMESGGGFRIDMELTTPEADAKHKFETNDFTLECWHYNDGSQSAWHSLFRSAAYNNPSGTGGTGIAHYGYSQTLHPYSVVSGNGQNWGATGNVVPYKKWHHTAWTRQGGVNRIFANGILVKTFNNSNSWDNRGWEIGDVHTWTGGYQDARIYNGVAKYTENFVVPATEPDILPDTPSGITGKTNLAKITEGSVTFSGTNDRLEVPKSTDFDFPGEFTMEAWVYANSLPTGSNHYDEVKTIFESIDWNTQLGQYQFGISNNNRVQLYMYNSTNTYIKGTTTLGIGRWYHLAVSRDSSNDIRLFVNGILENTVNNSYSLSNSNQPNPARIGRTKINNANKSLDGFISNVRVIKGTALYTSNFTPPTEPLTEVTNTKLLCCQSNSSAVDTAVVPGSAPNTRNWSARTNWNSGGTLTNASSYPLTAAFDGNLNTTFAMSYAGGMIWTAPTTISFSSSIEVYVNSSHGVGQQGYITTISGSQQSKVDVNADASWQSIYSGSGTFDKLEITRNTGGNNNNLWITAIRVDGVVLVDAIAAFGNTVATNFNPFTDDINTIRGQASGYATLNPLDVSPSVIATRGTTLSDGNLTSTVVNPAVNRESVADIGATSGKYYYEAMFDPGWNSSNSDGAGWVADDGLGVDNSTAGGFVMIARDVGSTIVGNSGSRTNQAAGTHPFNYSPGDVMGCAIDLDSRIATWYKNGQKHSFVVDFSSRTNLNGLEFKPLLLNRLAGSVFANFGQKPFKFPPPDGFQPLNLSNVQPEKVIARPDQYVRAVIYNGDGGTSNSVSGLSFQSDLVWGKCRTGDTLPHNLFDSVRGFDKQLESNSTNAQVDRAGDAVTVNSTGFTIDATYCNINNGSTTNVAWCWKAGGNKNTFNVDDVGYANASDVNMNVGAFNNYNTSRVWSNGIANSNSDFDQAKTNAFNGDRSNKLRTGSNSVLVTLNFSPALTVASTIEILGEDYATANFRYTVTVDGTTTTKDVDQGQPATFNVSGSLTQITFDNNNSNGRTYLEWIKVDGKELIDSNITPPNFPATAATGCSVGTKQGFSIVSYTSAAGDGVSSVPHGLSQTPDFVLIKNRDTAVSSQGWPVWHSAVPTSSRYLDSTNAWDATEFGHVFNSTAPTSNIVTVRANSAVSSGNRYRSYGNGDDFIMYCWHNIPGLQKFGSYTSTGTTNGPFVELGFRPAILWIKNSARNGEEWVVYDNRRQSYNPNGATLYLNNNSAEYDGNSATGGNSRNVDFLSNGFKINDVGNPVNISGQSEVHIYCAWAEAPTVNLYGAQSNAR